MAIAYISLLRSAMRKTCARRNGLRARVFELTCQMYDSFHVIGLRKHVDQMHLLDPIARF
jgi:hypothetical protein